jgi:hypothetical protein
VTVLLGIVATRMTAGMDLTVQPAQVAEAVARALRTGRDTSGSSGSLFS